MQTGHPETLRVIAVIRGGQIGEEIRLHEKFRSDRLRGEWFNRSRPLMEFISSLEVPLEPPPKETIQESGRRYSDLKRKCNARVSGGNLRIARARRLLNDKMPIGEIAKEVGLSIKGLCRLRDDPSLGWLKELNGSCIRW